MINPALLKKNVSKKPKPGGINLNTYKSANKVFTVGCRLNQAEGDILESVNFDKSKPAIIINTCAVTQEAVRTSWKTIRRNISKKNKNTQVIVTGCLATLEKSKMEVFPGIDKVITQDEKKALLVRCDTVNLKPERSRPIVKIQDGCPNHCTFCIASIIRGQPNSITALTIAKNINSLVRIGFQEIVLTGLNLGAYGLDINSSLTDLLKNINTNSYRIRLSSIQPDTITGTLLDLWQTKRLCRHLHVPLQSGDDRILQMMKRRYTAADYIRIINMVYKKIPGVNIGTDIIVGFPTEDDRSFLRTYNLIEQLPFGYLHVFPYSVRAGTHAALLPDNIPVKIKKERVRLLRKLGEQKKHKFKQQFINTKMEVLVEEKNKGLTDNYLSVILPHDNKYEPSKLYHIIIKE